MDGGGNRLAGQRSRRKAYRAALVALDRMPGERDRGGWIRGWRGADALALDGLPGRLVARVRATRAAIRETMETIRRGAERAQG